MSHAMADTQQHPHPHNHDDKDIGLEHREDVEHGDKQMGLVADTEAAEYIDPTVHISEAENKRLRRIVFTR